MDIKLHIDLHNHPNVAEFGRDFDPAAFASAAAKTGVNSVNVFIKCNGGWCYYPTSVGTPYPYMTGDMLGDTVRECHARGIRVIGYICVALDYEQGARHPELLRASENGVRITEPKEDPFCMTMCTEGEYAFALLIGVEAVPLEIKRGRTVLTLPQISGFTAIVLTPNDI